MPIGVDDITSGCCGHVVQFYDRDADLVEAVAEYVRDGICAGEAVVVVATDAHRRAFEVALRAAGVDVAGVRRRGMFLTLGAAETLSLFHRDGRVDGGRFHSAIGGVLRHAADTGRPVRVYGEMVALLWEAGFVSAAIDLEAMWNDLGREIPFSLYCAYPSQLVSGPGDAEARGDVCRLHCGVQRRFGAGVDAPRIARLFAIDAFLSQGHGCDLVDNAALVVGELAANAFVHAQSPFTVAISSASGVVRISVHDASPVLPMPRHALPSAPSGRGLGLVAAVASSWGTERTAAGKVVWAELG